MILKNIIDEDFSNYKVPSMLLATPRCAMKCGAGNCHNNHLLTMPDIEVDITSLIKRYLNNPITSAIVCAGLEPFDCFTPLYKFLENLRKHTSDMFIIYTGYTEEESAYYSKFLRRYKNIIVKFGQYIPDLKSHYDEILGVHLASPNQYAKQIS